MKITPNKLTLGVREEASVLITDATGELQLVGTPTLVTVTFGETEDGVKVANFAAGETTGTETVTIKDSATVPNVKTVTVNVIQGFVVMTKEGSQVGIDDSVMARQYIMNNNLSYLSAKLDDVIDTLSTLLTLSITNQVTNAADLATTIATLVVISNKLSTLGGNSIVIR